MSGKPCTKKTAPEGVAFLLIETIDHQRVGFGRRRPKPFCYIEAPVCSRQAGAFLYQGRETAQAGGPRCTHSLRHLAAHTRGRSSAIADVLPCLAARPPQGYQSVKRWPLFLHADCFIKVAII